MTGQLLTRPAEAKGWQHDSTPGESDRSTLSAAPAELRAADLDDLLAASFGQLPAESDYEAGRRRRSIMVLLRWLSRFPGDTWQARWVASGHDTGGRAFPDERSHDQRGRLFKGARALICLGVILPDYPWLLDTKFPWLFNAYRQACDPGGFDKLEQELRKFRLGDRIVHESVVAAVRICMHTGKKSPALITADDLARLDAATRGSGRQARASHEALWRALHTRGQISGPTSLKALTCRAS